MNYRCHDKRASATRAVALFLAHVTVCLWYGFCYEGESTVPFQALVGASIGIGVICSIVYDDESVPLGLVLATCMTYVCFVLAVMFI